MGLVRPCAGARAGASHPEAKRADGRAGTHIDLELARGADVAPFAEQHAELRVDVRAAASIVERLAAAGGALAHDRHGLRHELARVVVCHGGLAIWSL